MIFIDKGELTIYSVNRYVRFVRRYRFLYKKKKIQAVPAGTGAWNAPQIFCKARKSRKES